MTKKARPKQIVYLVGAGATQAEVSYLGAIPVNILMKSTDALGEGIAAGILRRTDGKRPSRGTEDTNVDIEKLISLMVASGAPRFADLVSAMRRAYFEEIRDRLHQAKILEQPRLAQALFEMHNDSRFKTDVETLSGVLTTNHDGLLQIASQSVYGGINLGFPFRAHEEELVHNEKAPPVLQLHGSFTWKFAVPIQVRPLRHDTTYGMATAWVPPTVLKESRNYPFTKLSALAYELLVRHCDVLRVIGASLTQNDWNILSLIFNAQRHRDLDRSAPFRVELIMSHGSGESLKKECSYIKNLVSLGFLSDGKFDHFRDPEFPLDTEMRNSFAYWLKEKIKFHKSRSELGSGALGPSMAEVIGEAA